MTPQETTELTELENSLADGMKSYLHEAGTDCGYSLADVDACLHVVASYVEAVGHVASHENIMGEVQRAVTRLNRLNEKCDASLIETDQGEQICEIFNKAAQYAGLEVGSDDLTERWREW